MRALTRRIRIVSPNGVGKGTHVLDADTGEDLGLRVVAVNVRIGMKGPNTAWLKVYVDEVDVETGPQATVKRFPEPAEKVEAGT